MLQMGATPFIHSINLQVKCTYVSFWGGKLLGNFNPWPLIREGVPLKKPWGNSSYSLNCIPKVICFHLWAPSPTTITNNLMCNLQTSGWIVLVCCQEWQCYWCHHWLCDWHLLHHSWIQILQQYVNWPDLHGVRFPDKGKEQHLSCTLQLATGHTTHLQLQSAPQLCISQIMHHQLLTSLYS